MPFKRKAEDMLPLLARTRGEQRHHERRSEALGPFFGGVATASGDANQDKCTLSLIASFIPGGVSLMAATDLEYFDQDGMEDAPMDKITTDMMIFHSSRYITSFLPLEAYDDFDLMHALILWDGFEYILASSRLQQRKDLAMLAVRGHGPTLEYCPYKFRNDEEVVLAAIQQNSRSIEFASSRLKSEAKFLSKAVALYASCVRYL